ncbi:hypothetical protein HYT02_04365 [Candidatus Gottesmanbacteria bacterium]|nr:hypothetical protein [Candidatus Gottesmanbacteria bacterium]
MIGYIFRCTNSTEDECFERMLFGEVPKSKEIVDKVKKGDTLFLYNVTSIRLYGVFRADSDGGYNINPEAWNGRFPAQVKIIWMNKYKPITRRDFENIIKFNWRYPQPILNEDQIRSLEKIFKNSQRLPQTESTFRQRFPATHLAIDGHLVRSLGELNIDNWLFSQEFCHGYERKLPVQENIYCDFYIPLEDKKGYVYIEYWGREDEKYQERKQQKIAIYEKHNLQLIELMPENLENLDEIMPQKLRRYFKNKKYF